MEHPGTVERVDDGVVDVTMSVGGACAACTARIVCGGQDTALRHVTIHTRLAEVFSVGEQVIVGVERYMGVKAVLISYVYPFFAMLAVLLIGSQIELPELTSGLCALGVLPVYYFFVWIFRKKIEREITFNIRKVF